MRCSQRTAPNSHLGAGACNVLVALGQVISKRGAFDLQHVVCIAQLLELLLKLAAALLECLLGLGLDSGNLPGRVAHKHIASIHNHRSFATTETSRTSSSRLLVSLATSPSSWARFDSTLALARLSCSSSSCSSLMRVSAAFFSASSAAVAVFSLASLGASNQRTPTHAA